MSVEFIGFITNNNSSETIVRTGPVLDVPYIETVAKAYELAGCDRALLAFHSTIPDALQVGQHVLGITKTLKVMIAQRPGFTAPTLLARQLATLDQLSGGRVSLHVITGGNAVELRQDGNTLDDKDERYARTGEFLDILRAVGRVLRTGPRRHCARARCRRQAWPANAALQPVGAADPGRHGRKGVGQ